MTPERSKCPATQFYSVERDRLGRCVVRLAPRFMAEAAAAPPQIEVAGLTALTIIVIPNCVLCPLPSILGRISLMDSPRGKSGWSWSRQSL